MNTTLRIKMLLICNSIENHFSFFCLHYFHWYRFGHCKMRQFSSYNCLHNFQTRHFFYILIFSHLVNTDKKQYTFQQSVLSLIQSCPKTCNRPLLNRPVYECCKYSQSDSQPPYRVIATSVVIKPSPQPYPAETS